MNENFYPDVNGNKEGIMSIGLLNEYIKALYYMQIQIYGICNNINNKMYDMVNFMQNNLHNLNKDSALTPNEITNKDFENPEHIISQFKDDIFTENQYQIMNNYLDNKCNNSNFKVFGLDNNYNNYPQNNINIYKPDALKSHPQDFLNCYTPHTLSNLATNLNNSIKMMNSDFHFMNHRFMADNIIKEKENRNVERPENKALKEKFYELKKKNNKRFFQVVYMFKNKIKRMYRIDCMTRKINVNFYHYIRENYKRLNMNEELLEFFKNNIRYTSRSKFQEIDKKYPNFKSIYEEYLSSDKFKKLILSIKNKYDDEYLKLFFRHSKNFLNFYLKDSSNKDEEKNQDNMYYEDGNDKSDKFEGSIQEIDALNSEEESSNK